MISTYFNNEKPVIDKIITIIKSSAKEHGVELIKIALVGGWAKEIRKVRSNNKVIDLIEIQTIINNSPKQGGDVDFVIFINEITHGWKNILSKKLNIGIPENEKNGHVDIVLSLPANIRFPGIEVID